MAYRYEECDRDRGLEAIERERDGVHRIDIRIFVGEDCHDLSLRLNEAMNLASWLIGACVRMGVNREPGERQPNVRGFRKC